MKVVTRKWRFTLMLSAYVLILLLTLNCGVSFTMSTIPETPSVVTREVTRIVINSPTVSFTSTSEPLPTIMSSEPTRTPSVLPSATVTPKTLPVSVECELDDPVLALEVLSAIATDLLTQNIHTLRLTTDLEVPMEAVIRNGQQVDENLTQLVGDQLTDYQMGGDFIFDVSLDDLSEGKWVIKTIGGVTGIEAEQIMEIWQDDSTIWERPSNEQWIERELTRDEAMIPLANSLVTVDEYGHSINLSDVLIDALRPLPLVRCEDISSFQEFGWTVAESTSTGGYIQAGRERDLSSSNNMKAIAACLANSGISRYVDPSSVTNGIRGSRSSETVWLLPDSWLVDHSLVDLLGVGTIELTYLGQQRTMDGMITLRTDNTYEYLPITTDVRPPN